MAGILKSPRTLNWSQLDMRRHDTYAHSTRTSLFVSVCVKITPKHLLTQFHSSLLRKNITKSSATPTEPTASTAGPTLFRCDEIPMVFETYSILFYFLLTANPTFSVPEYIGIIRNGKCKYKICW